MCCRGPEIDISELETLFSAAAPSSGKGGPGGKTNSRVPVNKPEKVQLVIYFNIFSTLYLFARTHRHIYVCVYICMYIYFRILIEYVKFIAAILH